jgi:hypothetical protein
LTIVLRIGDAIEFFAIWALVIFIKRIRPVRVVILLQQIYRFDGMRSSGNLYEVKGVLYVDPTDLSFFGSQWGGKSKKEEGSLPEPWVKREEDAATSNGSSSATPTGILAVASKRQSPGEQSPSVRKSQRVKGKKTASLSGKAREMLGLDEDGGKNGEHQQGDE